MNRILRHALIGGSYFVQALKMRMEYRTDFLVECMASLLQQASGLLTLKFLFNNFHALNTWTQYEVFFIYGFSLIPLSLFDLFSMNLYMFSDKYIVSGELDRLLLRPLSSLFQLLMEGIGFDFVADLTLGVIVLGYSWHQVGPPITFLVCVKFAVFVVGGWAVLAGVFLTLTSFSFWSQDRFSILPPVYNLLSFARYPLNIYRPFVRLLLTWVIPFGFVAFYPSAGFLTKGAAFKELSYYVPLAGLVMLSLGIGVWCMGLRKYAGAGT